MIVGIANPDSEPVQTPISAWFHGKKKSGVGMKRRYGARFVRPIPPLFIEPVLTSPADCIHLGSLPKRAKLDEYYVRSTVPGVVYDSLLQRPHNVAVPDPLNALGRGDNSIVLMKSNSYGPDVRENASSEKGSYTPQYHTVVRRHGRRSKNVL